jgi:hypothetical protein
MWKICKDEANLPYEISKDLELAWSSPTTGLQLK